MGMNVAPPEAGDGEGGDASTPWFSGQDARGPARLASTVDEAPTGGAFAPPPGWATTETISPGASLRARWASGSSSLTHRSADATEANVVARRPVSARNRRRRTGSSRVAPTATAHRAAFRHRLGGVLVPSLGFRNGHLGPCIGPAQQAAGADGPGSLAPLGSPARGTPADRWAGRRLGERVRCAYLEGIEVGAARGAPIQLGASCFSGRGCAIESGETGGKVKPGTTLGLLAGPPERPERLQGGGALSGGAPPPEAIDLMGMNVAPPEAGNGEGGDASTPWFSGQDARGPARLASTVDDAPAGGAFAPHLVGQRQKRSPRGRACVRAGRPGAGRSRTEAPTRRRRTSSHGGQCPRRTTGAELEARALPREPQRIERLSAIVSGAGACHHWGSAMATWGRASGPPNPPLVPTVRAAALRAAARPAAHRQTVGLNRFAVGRW